MQGEQLQKGTVPVEDDELWKSVVSEGVTSSAEMAKDLASIRQAYRLSEWKKYLLEGGKYNEEAQQMLQ